MDFIQAVVETRKVTDLFVNNLTSINYNDVKVDLSLNKPLGVLGKLATFMGLGDAAQDLADTEAESPIVFCYSLFYVYYDQYTYITGVLAQDVLMGLLGIFIAIQVSILNLSFQPNHIYLTIDSELAANLPFRDRLRVFGVLRAHGVHVDAQRSSWRVSSRTERCFRGQFGNFPRVRR